MRELLRIFPEPAIDLPFHMSWRTFEFVLIQETACLLVSEDMAVCFKEVVGVWKASRDFLDSGLSR